MQPGGPRQYILAPEPHSRLFRLCLSQSGSIENVSPGPELPYCTLWIQRSTCNLIVAESQQIMYNTGVLRQHSREKIEKIQAIKMPTECLCGLISCVWSQPWHPRHRRTLSTDLYGCSSDDASVFLFQLRYFSRSPYINHRCVGYCRSQFCWLSCSWMWIFVVFSLLHAASSAAFFCCI